jgi:hypothetical protein
MEMMRQQTQASLSEANRLRIARNRKAAREKWRQVLLPMPWDVTL